MPSSPRVTSIVAKCPEEPVFVVPEQADDLRLDLALNRENRIHTAFGVWTAINVVAQKHNRVTPAALAVNLVENVGEGLTIAVDIPDCNSGHAD